MKWFSSTFVVLALSTFCIFIVISIGGILQSKMLTSPVLSMTGLTSSVSSSFFSDMLAMEVPHLQREGSVSSFSQRNMTEFLFRFLTNVNPSDLKTVMASEVPGLGNEFAVLLHSGTVKDGLTPPVDYTPSKELLLPDEDPVSETDPIGSGEPELTDPMLDETEIESAQDEENVPVLSTQGKSKVFIYHSHSRESWVPELADKGVTELKDAFDSEINITLLGERLAGRLEDLGIGSVSSDTDYPTEAKDYNWNFSYKYSLKTVQEAFAVHPDLEYFIDIHRDSQKKDITTVTIDDKKYAQVYFIIGHKNPNWEKNEAFAKQIHELMEEKYPGISRGVWGKTANSGHAEYNQSFSENSILVEVGGPENTLEESYRTIDILGSAISEIFWDAKVVDVPTEDLIALWKE